MQVVQLREPRQLYGMYSGLWGPQQPARWSDHIVLLLTHITNSCLVMSLWYIYRACTTVVHITWPVILRRQWRAMCPSCQYASQKYQRTSPVIILTLFLLTNMSACESGCPHCLLTFSADDNRPYGAAPLAVNNWNHCDCFLRSTENTTTDLYVN